VEGVDAMLLSIEELTQGIEVLSQLITAVGNIPVGVSVKIATREDMKRLTELGCDFIVFGANEVPAAILIEEGVGKVLEVDSSLNDSLIRTISRLPIDAVLLEIREQPLTVRHLMDYTRITSLTGKPSLATLPPGLRTDDLEGLWQAGIRGVVLDIEQQRLPQVKEAIQALKPAKGRMKRGIAPSLPIISEEMGEVEEEI
jgi:hypothetical protein